MRSQKKFALRLPSSMNSERTVFADAPREVAICAFPILAPIPFGTSLSDNHASLEEFVENMASISATHKSWAKLIVNTLEQQATD